MLPYIYILKKSRISVLQQRYGLNPRRESGIHGNLGSQQAGNESQTRILGSTGVWDPWGPRPGNVEDLPLKKFGIKKTDDSVTRCPGFFPG